MYNIKSCYSRTRSSFPLFKLCCPATRPLREIYCVTTNYYHMNTYQVTHLRSEIFILADIAFEFEVSVLHLSFVLPNNTLRNPYPSPIYWRNHVLLLCLPRQVRRTRGRRKRWPILAHNPIILFNSITLFASVFLHNSFALYDQA